MDKMLDNREEAILKWILGQIVRAKKRKKQLDDRLMEINAERNAPIGGIGYDPMPRSAGTGNGAASILIKLSDIEERIHKQKQEIERCITRVMDIMDYLPLDSLEREVCELYYIDGKRMSEIEAIIPMSRANCYNKLNAAIDLLLTYPRIRTIVRRNEQAYDEWCYQRGIAQDRRRSKNQSGVVFSEIDSGNNSRRKNKKA